MYIHLVLILLEYLKEDVKLTHLLYYETRLFLFY